MNYDGYGPYRADNDQPTSTTRVPAGETDYLAKAAALLDKAATDNERANNHSARLLGEGRERIAGLYAQLGAIQRGQLPADLVKQILDHIAGGTR